MRLRFSLCRPGPSDKERAVILRNSPTGGRRARFQTLPVRKDPADQQKNAPRLKTGVRFHGGGLGICVHFFPLAGDAKRNRSVDRRLRWSIEKSNQRQLNTFFFDY